MSDGLSNLLSDLPRYRCHKEVQALKIERIVPAESEHGDSELHFEGRRPIEVKREWVEKHKPQAGGYYVVYADGYTSYSPAAAFEGGYTLIGRADLDIFAQSFNAAMSELNRQDRASGHLLVRGDDSHIVWIEGSVDLAAVVRAARAPGG